MSIVMGKCYWDQNFQPDIMSMCPMDSHKPKMDSSKAKKMLSHHKPVILGFLPQYLRKPEMSNFLNQYFLMIIPDSLSIISRKILFQICMAFTKCHMVLSQGVIGVTLSSLMRLPHKFYIFEVKRLPSFAILNAFFF